MVQIEEYYQEVPPPETPYMTANYQQLTGLVKALRGKPLDAAEEFELAATWFEEQQMRANVAVCWLQYAWTLLGVDDEKAFPAALAAYEHMRETGFRSNNQLEIARQIAIDAEKGLLAKETLRQGILLAVCPQLNLKPRHVG